MITGAKNIFMLYFIKNFMLKERIQNNSRSHSKHQLVMGAKNKKVAVER
jgi:hypothetical protein